MRLFHHRLPQPDLRFVVDDYEPAYLETWRRGLLEPKVEVALKELEDCRVCPRNCGIDRLRDEQRVCHTGRYAVVSSAFPHFGEEGCLRGHQGSGTIFFGLCNLRCVFCQNWDISQRQTGREMTAEEIASLALELQARGCHNINFVTPEHVAPQVVEAIAVAVPRGLRVPIVYNTSAYDSLASLKLMEGLVDIYMPDFKFWHRESARVLCKAKDYPEVARAAIREMHRQVGDLRFGADGLACRGLLVRHLVMPGQTDETEAIMRWLAEEISGETYVNIMGQYQPQYQVGEIARDGKPRYQAIDRRPTDLEMTAAYRAAQSAGLSRLDIRV
ncbi:MAG: radical SAM protein [Myxococcales bacterium]|nr:radical SAM protein [Myxococcales bacterium]MDH3484456.1 radical SAM protein [Myxococcales bacterium]